MAKGKSAAGPEILRRLSARDICGDIKKLVGEEQVDLFHVYGIANGIKTKATQYGEAIALVGQFEAVRLDDGEVLQGISLYLPEPFHSMLVEQVRDQGKGGAAPSVQFGFTIGVKPSKKSATGYEYTSKAMMKPEQRAQLDALRGEFKGLLENKG